VAQVKSIDLWLDLEPPLPDVRIDPARIDQVLSNLVANAVGHSDPDTSVTVRARRAGDVVEIQVADQGAGIARDELEALLSVAGSAQVEPANGEAGPGIGIAIAKRIVAAHGGTIRASSPPGEGSTFAFTLPIVGADLPCEEASEALEIVDV
jgi:signal transduction histidine kinase